jgi:hypothetical protein
MIKIELIAVGYLKMSVTMHGTKKRATVFYPIAPFYQPTYSTFWNILKN